MEIGLFNRNKLWETLLHQAGKGGWTTIYEFLMSKGMSPMDRNQLDETPCMLAVLDRKKDVLTLLIEHSSFDWQ